MPSASFPPTSGSAWNLSVATGRGASGVVLKPALAARIHGKPRLKYRPDEKTKDQMETARKAPLKIRVVPTNHASDGIACEVTVDRRAAG